MKLKLGKNAIFFGAVTLSMAAMIWFGMNSHIDFGLNPIPGIEFPTGRVVEVVSDQTELNEHGVRVGQQELIIQLLTGKHRGRTIESENRIFFDYGVYAQPGESVIVYFEPQEGSDDYYARVHSHARASVIYAIAFLFLVLLVITAGKAGLRSGFGLVFTFVVLLFLLIPAVIHGAPPALTTFVLSLVITAVSLIAIMGFEKKTYICIAGTSLGIVLYCLFYVIISAALYITGYNIPEMSTLIAVGFEADVSIGEFLFCGIMIASLGAVMDNAVSVASAAAELSAANKRAGFKELFKTSMVIARDIIGSSSNTLIMAFVGTFFVTLVIYRINSLNYDMLINSYEIAVEVLRAVSASIATILCAPVTALIGAHVYGAKQRKKAKNH